MTTMEARMDPIPAGCECLPPCWAEHFIAGDYTYIQDGVEIPEEEFWALIEERHYSYDN